MSSPVSDKKIMIGHGVNSGSTRSRQLLVIVPRLPTKFCGVGDHALAVGDSLESDHGLELSYLGVNANSHEPCDDQYSILPQKTASALVAALRHAELEHGAHVVLHFSGYSYGTRGICFWLVRAIEQFLAERSDVRLVTMFHELWAPVPLLSRNGWVVPLQKSIVRRLVRASSIVRTNRAEYAQKIERMCPKATGAIRVRNICSNFGEPTRLPSIEKRSQQIVIFQPPDELTDAGQKFWSGWKTLASQLGWPKTIVAGRANNVPSHSSIELVGFVSAEEGSRLMLESQFVYLEYFDGYLGKSSFFGSVAAHGIVPVMPRVNRSEADGLYHGRHYLLSDDAGLVDSVTLQHVADALANWYSLSSVSATANDYADGILGSAHLAANKVA